MMSDTVGLALIAMIGGVAIPAGVSCIMGILAYLKSKQAFDAAASNASAIQELRVTIDGRMDELLATTAIGSRAAGVVEGTNATRAAHAAHDRLNADPATAAAITAAREVLATAVLAARELVAQAQIDAVKLKGDRPSPLETKLGENTIATAENTKKMAVILGEPDADHVGIRRS